MSQIRKLFLLLVVIGPLHMAEQLLTSIEEFYSIRRLLDGYYAWFDPGSADWATVVLITITWTIGSLLMYALLLEGRARRIVLGVFGLLGIQELHHVAESVAKGGYDAGVVTCVPYAVVGALLLAAVWREARRGVTTIATERSFA
jgi:hypothetical protein